MDEILIAAMNDVTYYVADLDIINDDNYYKRISFDKAIKEEIILNWKEAISW